MTELKRCASIRILGIDPGLRTTGIGIIESDGRDSRYIFSQNISVQATGTETGIAKRLGLIFTNLTEIIEQYKPDEVAVEEVFVSRNFSSALKLGHARGAAICAAVQFQVPVSEYSARFVKQAVVGNGAASKHQIQHMVLSLLGLRGVLQADEADALAVSLCHAHSSTLAVGHHGSNPRYQV